MSKVIFAGAAAALLKDGDIVGASALTLAGWAEAVAIAIEKRLLASSHTAKLSLVHASSIGDWKTNGTEHFAHPGMIARWIGGHTRLAPGLATIVVSGACEGYCIPQGVITQLSREIAAHRPGLIPKTGLGTFVDPRQVAGEINKATTKNLVKIIDLEGEEWLVCLTFKVDLAIIRGTTADENGNMNIEDEGVFLECFPLAQAARNTGGIVIAEVAYIAKTGTLRAKPVPPSVSVQTPFSWSVTDEGSRSRAKKPSCATRARPISISSSPPWHGPRAGASWRRSSSKRRRRV
jgi:propionate CoA-transferase